MIMEAVSDGFERGWGRARTQGLAREASKGCPLVEYVDRCVLPTDRTDFGMAVCQSTVGALDVGRADRWTRSEVQCEGLETIARHVMPSQCHILHQYCSMYSKGTVSTDCAMCGG